MKTKQKTKKKQQHKESLLESSDLLQNQIDKTPEFILAHKNTITAVLSAIALVVGSIFLYKYYVNQQNIAAQSQLFPAIFLFEKGSLEQALLGDGGNFTDGLLAISDEYSTTDAANLANFYIGAIYLKQANYEEAISYLKKFSGDDYLIQGRVYSLIADAYLEQENIQEAVNYYKKAIAYKPNEQFTPDYLIKLALAYEMTENYQEAINTYDKVVNEYNASPQVNKAKKFLAKLSAVAESN